VAFGYLLVALPAGRVDEQPNGNSYRYEEEYPTADQPRAKGSRARQASYMVRDRRNTRLGRDKQSTKFVHERRDTMPARFVGFLRLSGIEVRHLASLLFLWWGFI
jgi:hypothetical protein